MADYAVIERRLEQVKRGMGEHGEQLEQIFGALRQLIVPPSFSMTGFDRR